MWLVVVASLLIFIVVYYFVARNYKIKPTDDYGVYRSKDFLLNKTEKMAYDKLLHFFKDSHLRLTVFPKVRLSDFVWTPRENRNAYLRIQNRFVDFLILKSPSLKPEAAIFIVNEDNKSKMDSLAVIEGVLKSVGIKLIKVNVRDIFEEAFIEKLKEELKWL